MKYYTDGFMIGGNPSDTGGGFTIVDENNESIHREVVNKKNFTNNEAETLGILKALTIAKEGDTVSTDSMCCLGWVNRGKSKARPDLNELLSTAKFLAEKKKINLCWERRDFNLAGIYNEQNPPQKEEWEMAEIPESMRDEIERQMSFLKSI